MLVLQLDQAPLGAVACVGEIKMFVERHFALAGFAEPLEEHVVADRVDERAELATVAQRFFGADRAQRAQHRLLRNVVDLIDAAHAPSQFAEERLTEITEKMFLCRPVPVAEPAHIFIVE